MASNKRKRATCSKPKQDQACASLHSVPFEPLAHLVWCDNSPMHCLIHAFNALAPPYPMTIDKMLESVEIMAQMAKKTNPRAKLLQLRKELWNPATGFKPSVLLHAAGAMGIKFIVHTNFLWTETDDVVSDFAPDLDKNYIYIGISNLKEMCAGLGKYASAGYGHACALRQGRWIDSDYRQHIDMTPPKEDCPPHYFYVMQVLELVL